MTKARREFTPEFKREAVALLEGSGRPQMQVAAELGIQPSMLRTWRTVLNGGAPRSRSASTNVPAAGSPVASPSDQAAEIAKPRRALDRTRMERDVLKKAIGIFAEMPKRGSASSSSMPAPGRCVSCAACSRSRRAAATGGDHVLRQDWPAYNAAQVNEAKRLPELLHGLCQGVVQAPQSRGRPRLPLADVVFCAVLKVYSTVSGRRAMSDLNDCQARGYITRAPHYNSTFNYLENPLLTPILKAMIEESASPLKGVETEFAVDASGFSTSRFERWYDAKWGREVSERQWLKAHLMCGTRTRIVTSVEITDGAAHDSPYLPPLLNATAERFRVAEVAADKGYIGKRNLAAILGVGATPYIPFKTNTTGKGPELWRRMFHFYMYNRETFLRHYHRRSNVETVFSMIKGKFGDAVRSKTPVAQVNEVLCKVLCHNLCVLIRSIYELGIELTF